MDKLFAGTIVLLIAGALILFAVCLGTIIGAIAGWAVGGLFDDTSAKVLTYLGLTDFAMWEIGATLGFVGGFFRNSTTTSSD